jgi:uncharacterized protein (TIGR00369 family)
MVATPKNPTKVTPIDDGETQTVRDKLGQAGWTQEDSPGSPFGELIGPTWRRMENGVERYGFVVETKHLNRAGGVHGGMVSAILDMSLARTIATQTGQHGIATIHLGIDFIDVARVGDFVEVKAEITRATKSVVFIRGGLVVGDRVIATADGLWKIVRPRS